MNNEIGEVHEGTNVLYFTTLQMYCTLQLFVAINYSWLSLNQYSNCTAVSLSCVRQLVFSRVFIYTFVHMSAGPSGWGGTSPTSPTVDNGTAAWGKPNDASTGWGDSDDPGEKTGWGNPSPNPIKTGW